MLWSVGRQARWLPQDAPRFVHSLKGRALRRTAQQQTRHLITNVIVRDETEGEARVLSYVLVAVTQAGEPTTLRTGWYRDRMVKESGTWLIRDRRIKLDPDTGYQQTAFDDWTV